MDDSALDQVLAATYEDARVSRGERKALHRLVQDQPQPAAFAARVRNRAFVVAQNLLEAGEHEHVLSWLEDTVKAVWPRPETPRPAKVKASKTSSDGAEAWFSPHGDIADVLKRLLDKTRRRLDICVFTITDDRLSRAVIRAHQRGVAVRILSDDDKSADRGSDIDRFARAGVNVRVDRSPHHMHHKFALVDGEMLLNGSYNWTRSADRKNAENLMAIADGVLFQTYQREFERLWSKGEAL